MTIAITIIIASTAVTFVFGQMLCSRFIHKFIITETEIGLLFKKGMLVKALEAGAHTFYGQNYTLEKFDGRIQQFSLQPQEIYTADSISVKVTALVDYSIKDGKKYLMISAMPIETIYAAIQIALRDRVSKVNLDEVAVKRKDIAKEVFAEVADFANQLGIEIVTIAVRDVILPNDVKAAIHETLYAQMQAAAKLEHVRGEVAAARAMANTVKQYAKNPEMMQLRYLEVLEKAAEGMGNTLVLGKPDDINQLLTMK